MERKYAYIRVSSVDQNEARQVAAMKEAGVKEEHIYLDKQSGKDFDRPGYQALTKILKKGDVLFISSIDRLGRNYEEMQKQWRILTKELGADIVVLDMLLLDTRIGKDLMGTFIADLVFHVLSFVAEKERDSIRARQMEGIATAKAAGKKFGRPKAELPEGFSKIIEDWENREISLPDVLQILAVSKATFYRKVKVYRDMLDQLK